MRLAVAGATWATQTCIEGLEAHGHHPIVLGQQHSDSIAGWTDLHPDYWYTNINNETLFIRNLDLDVLFVVGSSQLVGPDILNIPRLGCVGFHPTRLPNGRGRAPIAWLILGHAEPAATFFQMTEQADAGPIFAQVPFTVGPNDYAQDVCDSISVAMRSALDGWLPDLADWDPEPQDDSKATYLGVRRPHDGQINWSDSAVNIQRLIRAASHPHPGAYSGNRIIHRASVVDLPYRGVIGRVLAYDDAGNEIVQTGQGLLRLDEYDGSALKVGADL